MTLSHVGHAALVDQTIVSGGTLSVSGFSGILAGDLVVIHTTWGVASASLATIPTVTWPNGSFEEVDRDETAAYNNGQGSGGRSLLGFGLAAGGETAFGVTAAPDVGRDDCCIVVDVYRGLGAGLAYTNAKQTSFGATGTIPSVTPPEGVEAVIWTSYALSPDYHPGTISSGWTLNTEAASGGGPRETINSAHRFEDPTTGSYTGTVSGSVGGESGWLFYTVAFYEAPTPPEPKIVLTINDVEFTDLVEKRIRVELNDTGVITFAIHRGHPQATTANLAKGNLVQVTIPEIHDGVLFEGFLDSGDFALVASNEEGGEILSFTAPGSLSYLRRAKVHFEPLQSPASVVKLSRGTWEWINQEAGDIVQRLVSEAQDRDVLDDMTITFTETEDSDGNPWTPMGSWKEDIGADLLEAVQRLVAAGQLHVEMGVGLVLNLYETIGVDRSSTSFASGKVRFVKGVNVVDEITRGMNGPTYASHALVHGDDGSWREVESPSAYPYKAEIVVEVGSHDPDVMEAAGLRALAAREAAQESIIFGHRVPWPGDGPDEASGIYLPGPAWTDNGKYWVGDLVTLHTGTGELDYDNETFRVYAITMYEDATGYLAPPIVELNAPYVDTNESDGAGGGALPAGSGTVVGSSGSGSHSHSQYQVAGEDQWKQPVRCATTGSITISTALNAGDTIDGVTLVAGDRVLVKDQADPSENGVWIVGATPTRATDLDDDDEVLGAVIYVIAGTANAGTAWKVTNTAATVVDTDAIDWAAFGDVSIPAGTYELAIEGGQSVIHAHGNTGATETIDPTAGNVHTMTLDADCTLTLSAPVGSGACTLELRITQDGTGGWDITWPGSVTVLGTLDTTASTESIVILETLDGGTSWVAVVVGAGGGGTPATTVEAETTFGLSSAVGTDTEYARQDHTHGTPANPVAEGMGHYEVLMDGAGNPLDNGTGLDWLYVWVP